ncbi:FAD-dependent oxidoreductase [Dyella nitratireducens]|uniref:Oxidoreductase n=1 Tax=Dyella nitratireducens TaxID=1849580 RepID=A0ABQ1GLE7_9GAMM|nr:NAD(P)/FAD-dependent oxidoreductase [Dyella nitratireducens]GGA45540.1 oxidoreductase [Dyella nitratireducens]GLQ41333.1 oxidoreductase [Dyella nitratireducens]
MQGRLRIAIVGYGTAGQAAAIMLHAQGHALTVFEQAPVLRPVGAGFLLQPTGLGVLARLGLHEAALEQGQRIERLHGCNHRGRTVMDMRYADHAADSFGVGMTRGSLFSVLRDAYPDAHAVRTGVCIKQIATDEHGLLDAEGKSYGPFDLIVIADGAHSRLRGCVPNLVQRETMYPWGALWCLVPGDNWLHPNELRQRYAGTREMIGLLPVGRRVDHSGRWLTFYFSLPGDQVEAFDEQGFERMRERIAAIWPEASALLEGIDSPQQLNRARYRDVVMHAPVQGRVVFIGDAAHAMSPQLGQGVNMAMLDAEALALALAASSGLDEALQAYARNRRAHLSVYQRLSRWLTPWFQSERNALATWRDLGFGPLGRWSFTRGQMLKILTGTKAAWWR